METDIPIKKGDSRRGTVSFFRDDTIDVVRKRIALAVGSHPDRMFIEVKVKLPKDYYGSNPMRWKELFHRMTYDRARVSSEAIENYKDGMPHLTALDAIEYSELDWDDAWDNRKKTAIGLDSILNVRNDFYEWRILGVDSEMSLVLPRVPTELPDYNGIPPLPKLQSLFETMHPYPIAEFRYVATEEEREGPPEGIRKNYFPYFARGAPMRLPKEIGDALEQSHRELKALFALLERREAPKPHKHKDVVVLRAKWYAPLISTKFSAPRSRFEQIFYGLTVSKDTPYIGYFTAKSEVTRHKFYVEDPNNKVVDEEFKPMWRAWTNKTQPQRRRPTLLLYRGTSRSSFDRIAITSKDIVFSAERDKTSEETLDEIRDSIFEWFKTLDAVVPFIEESDYDISRWQLDMLNALATYSNSVSSFDPARFGCLRSIFSNYGGAYRLLRAEHSSDDISPLEIQAYQILTQDDVTPSAELLREQLDISPDEAEALFSKIKTLGETFDIEKAAKAYPILKFSGSEVVIKFVTNLERTLDYADILRFVLSLKDGDDIGICERDIVAPQPVVAVPQQAISDTDYDASNEDFLAGLGLDAPDEPPAEEEPGAAAAREPLRRIAVAQTATSTFNYFNNRLQEFDRRTFDSTYPGECERNRQVIVLDTDQQEDIRNNEDLGDTPEEREVYTYSERPDSEKLQLEDPDGLAICPPYWCIRDEIPLLPPVEPWEPGHLRKLEDGTLECPVCHGKIRTSDRDNRTDFTVIERNTATIYPKLMKAVSATNKRRMPCCYKVGRSSKEVKKKKGDDINYVIGVERARLPPLRFAYLDPELASRLRLIPDYEASVRMGRIGIGNKDIFRIGIGRASENLPKLLGVDTEIKRPKEAQDNVKRCSFFLSWNKLGGGESQTEKIIDGIDRAYMAGDLDILKEIEYVASFLDTTVIRIDPKTYEVICGFWTESIDPEKQKIVALIGTDMLGFVSRKKGVRSHVLEYKVDLRKHFSIATRKILTDAHTKACSPDVPTLNETLNAELRDVGDDFSYILDPFDRVQAVYAHGKGVLPFRPEAKDLRDSSIRKVHYSEIRPEELPEPAEARAFLNSRTNDGFKIKEELYDSAGNLVEFLLNSGFRSPVKIGETKKGQPAQEVIKTIQNRDERDLVDGPPNVIDDQLARDVSYEEELYQFMLYSISKDLDSYSTLREAIESRDSERIKAQLVTWFADNAYTVMTQRPANFVNKVRKPCGQFNDADSCNNSTLCGWVSRDDTCRIKVRVKRDKVSKDILINRIANNLARNDKLRNLVLDDRISPFFSTILYLEMPHELITTDI